MFQALRAWKAQHVTFHSVLRSDPTNVKLAALTLFIALSIAVGVRDADARPGTPTNLRAWAPNAWLVYFFFTNTANESVGFEWEVTADGRPVARSTLDCSLHKGLSPHGAAQYGGTTAHPACQYAPIYSSAPDRALKGGYGRELVTFSMNVTPKTTYCFRVRAREWDDSYGRQSSWYGGLVSELWSGWVCATTGPPPPPPAAPSKPDLTYFPAGKRAEGTQPDQLLIEWNGRLEPPDQDFRLQQLSYYSSGQPRDWNACSNSEGYVSKLNWQRTGPRRLYREVITNLGEPSLTNRLTFRICNVNRFGCSCSLPNSVYNNPAAAIGSQQAKSGKFGPPFIQRVAPSTYTKVNAQAPEYLQVQLTFEGSAPDRARYSIDEGLSMACGAATAGAKLRCWVDAAQLIVVGNTATVWVPYSAIQQAKQQIYIELSNKLGASSGMVQIASTLAGEPPAVKHDLLAPQSPAPSREPPRAPGAAPKSIPPLQQQAPGKSTGSVFQR